MADEGTMRRAINRHISRSYYARAEARGIYVIDHAAVERLVRSGVNRRIAMTYVMHKMKERSNIDEN